MSVYSIRQICNQFNIYFALSLKKSSYFQKMLYMEILGATWSPKNVLFLCSYHRVMVPIKSLVCRRTMIGSDDGRCRRM